MNDTTVYISCPYEHKNKHKMKKRVEAATKAARVFFQRETAANALIPILVAHILGIPPAINTERMLQCSKLAVLLIDGWWDDKNVQREIGFAKTIGMPIVYMTMEDT